MASDNKLHVSEHFTGHGVGALLHMPPMVMHHRNLSKVRMEPGMVFTIEPIFTLKRPKSISQWSDEFTILSPNTPSA